MATKVLIIDDSRTMRTLLRAAIEPAGFECCSAEDGVAGIEEFKNSSPDVVITDINMPNMDGFGVIETLRGEKIGTCIPILVLTTETAPELKSRARDSGATGWIVKPFDDSALITILNRVTGKAA